MVKFREINRGIYLTFVGINFCVLILIYFQLISYGPDLQDVFMSFLIVIATGIGSVLYFLVKSDGQSGLRLTHYVLYAGYFLEVLYLMFEN
ncbi:MAG: hypothetical protein H6599_07180 [Flavobacteriales bacterium]|nr:hypothetical protein [Flavobacteriales bacterium]